MRVGTTLILHFVQDMRICTRIILRSAQDKPWLGVFGDERQWRDRMASAIQTIW
jgi:hypothetical protein